MQFSNLVLSCSIFAALVAPSDQAGLRRKLTYAEAEPDCASIEDGFQTCKNEQQYYECNHGWLLTRPLAEGTKCCPNNEKDGRIYPVPNSANGCSNQRVVDSNSAQYDEAFDYPTNMPPPPEMFLEGFARRLQAQNIQNYEGTIQVWQTWRLDQAMWNCIAHYHSSLLNAITKTDPTPRVPEQYHTSEARALCMIHAVNKLVPEVEPTSSGTISSWLDELGLDSSIMDDAEAEMLAIGGNPTPRVIGSLVASEVIQDMQNDGWNHNGLKTADSGTCTANCRRFTDTYGYVPKNSPWEISDPIAWQPLIESNGLGFFYAQEHVTPHIGFHAKPVILSRAEIDERKLEAPNYDYEMEATKAIENTADLTDYKKAIVKFMDNKINISGGVLARVRGKYGLSLEAQIFYHYGYTASEVDVILLAWKEKVRHNLIRPTSVVQALGDVEVTSFAGSHKAKDWVPLVRVMPHTEYPSGSACICTAVYQFVDAFLSDQYGEESIETTWGFEGIDPVTFENMQELAKICGESREWGGMHFSKSVPNGNALCDGVGTRGYTDLVKPLLGSGTYAELMDATKMKYEGGLYDFM